MGLTAARTGHIKSEYVRKKPQNGNGKQEGIRVKMRRGEGNSEHACPLLHVEQWLYFPAANALSSLHHESR